jgi:hypothetical protein
MTLIEQALELLNELKEMPFEPGVIFKRIATLRDNETDVDLKSDLNHIANAVTAFYSGARSEKAFLQEIINTLWNIKLSKKTPKAKLLRIIS